MVEKIANILAERIVFYNGQRDNKEIYNYGLQIMLNTFFSISVVLLLGIINKVFLGTIIFLICYCSIRLFAGGLHASSNSKCMLIFVGGYIAVCIILKQIDIALDVGVICTMLLFIISILLWAPVDVVNNPVSLQKKKVMKKRAFFISIIITIVIFVLFFINYKMAEWAFAGVSWSFCILVTGKIKNTINLRRYL